MRDLFAEWACRPRHLVVVIAQGLSRERTRADDMPNLRLAQRVGVRLGHCRTEPGKGDLAHLLRPSGEGPGTPSLAAGAAAAGRLVLYFLPLKSHAPLAPTSPPFWRVTEAALDRGTVTWEDLLAGSPRFDARGENENEDKNVGAFFADRILARFPGIATLTQRGSEGNGFGALNAWMEWISDAFLRSLWFASGYSERGICAVLVHPAPALLAGRNGRGGYRRAADLLDDLWGRLFVLREHGDLEDSVLAFCGTGAGPEVPFAAVGAGLEERPEVEEASLQDIGEWLRKVAGSTAGAEIRESGAEP